MAEERLRQLYYDPRQGYLSAVKLKHKASDVRYKDIDAFLQKQQSYQMTRVPRRRGAYRSITAPHPTFGYQIDLMIYDRFEFHNYKYILTCIDVHSRYVAARPLTTRVAPNVLTALKSVFQEMGVPLNVNCDQEFVQSDLIRQWMLSQGITIYASDPDEPRKNALIESFHRTLALMLQRWRQSAGGLRDWPKVLPDIIHNYNHTVHSTIKQTPADVFEGTAQSLQIAHTTRAGRFKVGDIVRVLNKKGIFDKGDALRYSKDVFTVTGVEGARYKVTNNGVQSRRRYKDDELIIAAVEHPDGKQAIASSRPKRSTRRIQKELETSLPTPREPRQRRPNQFHEDFIPFA